MSHLQKKNKGNQKSETSKRWIENSLLKLMETEAFHEITIQEIAGHAGLSRRTFYRNFNSKEEIIIGRFERIWAEYESMIKLEEDLSMPNITKVFFTIMTKYLDFLLIINHHHLLPVLGTKADELLPPVFYKLKGSQMSFSEETISYALLFGTGGLMKILINWLSEEKRKTPEEMADLMKRIIMIVNYPVGKNKQITEGK